MHKARSIHIGIKSPRQIYNLEIHFDEQYKLEKTLFSKHAPLRIFGGPEQWWAFCQ